MTQAIPSRQFDRLIYHKRRDGLPAAGLRYLPDNPQFAVEYVSAVYRRMVLEYQDIDPISLDGGILVSERQREISIDSGPQRIGDLNLHDADRLLDIVIGPNAPLSPRLQQIIDRPTWPATQAPHATLRIISRSGHTVDFAVGAIEYLSAISQWLISDIPAAHMERLRAIVRDGPYTVSTIPLLLAPAAEGAFELHSDFCVRDDLDYEGVVLGEASDDDEAPLPAPATIRRTQFTTRAGRPGRWVPGILLSEKDDWTGAGEYWIVESAVELDRGRITQLNCQSFRDPAAWQTIDRPPDVERATLSSLTWDGSTEFAADNYGPYTADATEALALSWIKASDMDVVTVQIGGIDQSGFMSGDDIPYMVGIVTVVVTVAAEGKATSSYRLNVRYGLPPVAELTGLTFDEGLEFAPAFDPLVYAYTATVDHDTLGVTPTATAESGAMVSITAGGVPILPGVFVLLSEGQNVIAFEVTKPGETTQTYTVTVTRQPEAVAQLRRLEFSSSTDEQNIPFTPAFSPAAFTYTLPNFDASRDEYRLIIEGEFGSNVRVTTDTGQVLTDPRGGNFYEWPLHDGVNVLTIRVTSEGEGAGVYTITSTRPVAQLTGLTITDYDDNPVTLDPVFDPAVLSYTHADVPNDFAGWELRPVAESGASFTVTANGVAIPENPAHAGQYDVAFNVGLNAIRIRVSKAGEITQDYDLAVTKEAAPEETNTELFFGFVRFDGTQNYYPNFSADGARAYYGASPVITIASTTDSLEIGSNSDTYRVRPSDHIANAPVQLFAAFVPHQSPRISMRINNGNSVQRNNTWARLITQDQADGASLQVDVGGTMMYVYDLGYSATHPAAYGHNWTIDLATEP